jgi:hypothetical protein
MRYTVSIQYDGAKPYLHIEAESLMGTEVIQKVSVFNQDSWGTDNPAWESQEASTFFSETLFSESLEGACLNRDLIIVKFNVYNINATEKNQVYTAIVYNKKIEINKTLSYCKELCDCCKFPEGLLNSMLQVKALQYAIEANDVDKAITYWNKWYKGEWGCEGSEKKIGGCGCE